MHLGDTIAALASPPGRSSRALIRLSGPAVPSALRTLLDHPPTTRGPHSARLRLSPDLPTSPPPDLAPLDLAPPDLPLLLLYFPSPHSYTGEDTAELFIPGNPNLIDRVLARCTSIPGIRPAGPGEFSARAYLNGRLTLDQAEGIAAIVAAQTADQVHAAHDLLAGRTGHTYRAWADELTTLLALVEAGIDFTDQEDVVAIAAPALHARLAQLIAHLDAHLGAAAGRSVTSALPRVALVGPPNAGKSTLFNALLNRRRAVTSPTPHTTRDILAETLDLTPDLPGAPTITLLDLAGLDAAGLDAAGLDTADFDLAHLGTSTKADAHITSPAHPSPSGLPEGVAESARPGEVRRSAPSSSFSPPLGIDTEAQTRARNAALTSDLILLCDPTAQFDPSAPWSAFIPPNHPTIRIRTKADVPNAHRSTDLPTSRPPDLAPTDPIPICALDGWNLPTLRRMIAQHLTTARTANLAALLPRHRLALQAARSHLTNAIESISPDTETDTETETDPASPQGSEMTAGGNAPGHTPPPSSPTPKGSNPARLPAPELTAASLREALDALAELVGHITPDDILGRVFATFCIGK